MNPVAKAVTGPRVARSEWTKFRTLRSSWWTIAVGVALTAGTGVITSLAAAVEPASSAAPEVVAMRSQIGVILAQLALGTLAVLVVSGEYGTGAIRSTLTVVPKRLPVLWAKVAVFAGVVLPVMLAVTVATFLAGQAIWRGHGRPPVALTDPDVARIVVGAALYLTVAGLCAIGIATVLRSTAAGITAVTGLFFVLPTVMGAMPARIADAGRFLPSNAGGALYGLSTAPHPLAPWTGFGLLCGYAAIALIAGAWRLRRADA
jgi:ABC-type transport system involved in multi-copper enzyme maturation permease subunit